MSLSWYLQEQPGEPGLQFQGKRGSQEASSGEVGMQAVWGISAKKRKGKKKKKEDNSTTVSLLVDSSSF